MVRSGACYGNNSRYGTIEPILEMAGGRRSFMGSASRGLLSCSGSRGFVQGRRDGGGLLRVWLMGEVFCIADSDYCTWKE